MTEEVLHAQIKAEISADDPRTNVMALVNIVKSICQSLGKTPAEGAAMLMTAAAAILDQGAQGRAEELGEDYDPVDAIPIFMQAAAHGWNLNALMFRGVEEPELGEVTKTGVTLQ